MAKVLVLGAGFAGTTAAYLLRHLGHEVTVLEGEGDAGGGVRTRWHGGHPYTFGPRVFFSRDDEVIAQLTALVEMRQFYTRTWTYVEQDGQFYHYPITQTDLPRMPDYERIAAELGERKDRPPSVADFEQYWLDAIGPTLYHKFVDRYSKKMWGIESNKQLGANWEWVNRGTPIRESDTRLYTDQFQGYPAAADGYNGYFDRALEGSKAVFNCRIRRFEPEKRQVLTDVGSFQGDIIVNTVHVDALFGFAYGRLQFCGRQFLKVVLPIESVLPEDMTWIHYSGDEAYTRVTEFKKITNHVSESTLLGIEIPVNTNRYYPVQSEPELTRFAKYQAAYPRDFFSIGRMGSFRYKGIPDAIRDALDVAKAVGKAVS